MGAVIFPAPQAVPNSESTHGSNLDLRKLPSALPDLNLIDPEVKSTIDKLILTANLPALCQLQNQLEANGGDNEQMDETLNYMDFKLDALVGICDLEENYLDSQRVVESMPSQSRPDDDEEEGSFPEGAALCDDCVMDYNDPKTEQFDAEMKTAKHGRTATVALTNYIVICVALAAVIIIAVIGMFYGIKNCISSKS